MHARLLLLLGWTLSLSLLGGCTCGSLPGRKALRPTELAGHWYPEDRDELATRLDSALVDVVPSREPVRALVVPHAGLDYTAEIAGRAWGAVRGQPFDRIVLLAPRHWGRYAGVFLAAEGGYQTPLGPLLVDEDATAQLERYPLLKRRAAPFDGENSLELQLPWIAHLWPDARIVPVLVGRVTDAQLGELAQALESVLDERTLLVVSSDFVHTGDRFGTRLVPADHKGAAARAAFLELQARPLDALLAGDEGALVATVRDGNLNVCGLDALRVLLRLVGPSPGATLAASGSSMTFEFSHDDGDAVGYASLVVPGRWPAVPALDPASRETLGRIARESLEAAVADRASPPIDSVPPRLAAPGGAFVTLKSSGELRACMGRIVDERLADAVSRAAALTARSDLRFPPITPDELPSLEVELSLLGPLLPITDPFDFELGRHGLLLRSGDAQALLLPQVASEQGLDREGFLQALAEKAGLERDGWRDAELERFGVQSIPLEPTLPSEAQR